MVEGQALGAIAREEHASLPPPTVMIINLYIIKQIAAYKSNIMTYYKFSF